MNEAAHAQEYEQAALERNRLRAVRSLLERQRVANESVGTLDVVAVAVSGSDANAQVFQVRDGVLSDRQSFYLANEAERPLGDVIEEFVLQYYADALSIPAQVASMVVFEGGAPKKSDYRRFRVRDLPEGRSDDFAAMAEVLRRRFVRWERQADLSP